MSASSVNARFRDRDVVFANGAKGRNVDIPSASPANYHQLLNAPGEMPRVTIDGKLFLPPGHAGTAKLPLIIVVPGSLGVAHSHVTHAETLNAQGFATFVLDPFGARGVTSTVANQTQFSWAASAYDVLAAWKALRVMAEIDSSRIGAQGHSRGGGAVLTAVTRAFAEAVIGKDHGLAAILPAYPWSGHQFLDASVGTTRVHVLMGDRDEWCSPMQVQGHLQAIRMAGGQASMRLFGGAHHSFDRGTPLENVANASVSPAAPVSFINAKGAFVHPLTGEADPKLTDRDMAIYGIKAGYGKKGAQIGSQAGDAGRFRDDMVAFWKKARLPQGLADHHGCGNRNVQRTQPALQGDADLGIRHGVHTVGDASTLAAKQQHILGRESIVCVPSLATCRQQHQSMASSFAGRVEGGEVHVPD
jgi:dienelactone hydrolase